MEFIEVMKKALPHALLVASLIFVSLIAIKRPAQQEARKRAEDWTEQLQPSFSSELASFSRIEGPELERERLASQLELVGKRSEHHRTVTAYFLSNYYMAIMESLVFGAIAAIALFFITKSGFGSANPYVVTTFITATAITTFFGAFPSVFKQSENVADNKVLYLRYVALQNEMLTFSATGLGPSGTAQTPSKYIVSVDAQLNELNNLAIGFDFSKIPKYNFQSR